MLEGYKVAKEIAAHGAGASTFSDWWGYKIEASGATPWNAALMTRKGVLVSINSDSAEHSRRLNTEAAKSIKWGGLSDDEALALVTVNPARQLRVADRVGSIEPGKDADLVVWNRHPLSSYAVADRVYIDGTLVLRPVERGRARRRSRQQESRAGPGREGRRRQGQEGRQEGREQDGRPRRCRQPRRRPTAQRAAEATQMLRAPGNLKFSGQLRSSRIWSPSSTPAPPHHVGQHRARDDRLKAGRIEALGAAVAVPAGGRR